MLENKKYSIRFLDWDTEMFEKKSVKIILNEEILIEDLNNIKEYINNNDYEFIPFENKNNLEKYEKSCKENEDLKNEIIRINDEKNTYERGITKLIYTLGKK